MPSIILSTTTIAISTECFRLLIACIPLHLQRESNSALKLDNLSLFLISAWAKMAKGFWALTQEMVFRR